MKDSELHFYLNQDVQSHKIIRPSVFCAQEFVLKHGKEYQKKKLPKGIMQGEKKQCFFNAAILASSKNLIYVEGFAMLPDIAGTIHHAWCVKKGSDAVIDPTSSNLVEYFGIPFKSEAADEVLDKCNPILTVNKTEDEIEALISREAF